MQTLHLAPCAKARGAKRRRDPCPPMEMPCELERNINKKHATQTPLVMQRDETALSL